MTPLFLRLPLASLALYPLAQAATHAVDLTTPVKPAFVEFKTGTSVRKDGNTLTLDSRSLLLDNKPWIPVMGEFHYSRYAPAEWRKELLKIKAGGINIVATYVFWSHHEEEQGSFDWSGQRDLRRFVKTCGEVGLHVVVRCGPWCHGEVRNGGLPDWIAENAKLKPRSDDPAYLQHVATLYKEINTQLSGFFWKDSGPIIGIQIENEYGGPAEHLLTLKTMARAAGLDAPLYTRTGWPALKTAMPVGELLPLYGSYAEGFWDRELTPMPGKYWTAFNFARTRDDSAIATELLGNREARDSDDVALYPYLTCEIGGGMMSAYHRRIRIQPADIEATVLVKIGSGSNLPGYYMYHGGTNPDGRLTSLQENQSTAITNWNDMPTKGYDFQAPLGEFGQLRPHYHLLRRLHLFLADFGPRLAHMAPAFPAAPLTGKDDVSTLRWSVRSDGHSGFLFVNNHQRLASLTPKADTRFTVRPARGAALTFPSAGVTIPSGSRFIWPFNLELGLGAKLLYATAQPICTVQEGKTTTYFFAETSGVPAEFCIEESGTKLRAAAGAKITREGARSLITKLKPDTDAALTLATKDESIQLVLLSEADSLALWKMPWNGRDRVFLSRAGLTVDGPALRLSATAGADLSVGILPVADRLGTESDKIGYRRDGVFRRFTCKAPEAQPMTVIAEPLKAADPARTVSLGQSKKPVAAAPNDSDFSQAAYWRIKFPQGLDLGASPLLRINYLGDVARVTLNGQLVTDDFYNGNAFEIGLDHLGRRASTGELRLVVLPLKKDYPVMYANDSLPPGLNANGACELRGIELIPSHLVTLTEVSR